MKLTPFLKWAGGKRWLTKNHSYLFPEAIEKYIEPFAGSAAVLFHLQPKEALLADTNKELIHAYIALKQNWEEVYHFLEIHQKSHNKEYYYKMRSSDPTNMFENAAKFIYLNRTCWNGLYRVNLKGKFNVPIGSKTNVFLPTDKFKEISDFLQNVTLKVQDFELTIDMAKHDDCIFIDPPYTVKHNLNGFVKYNETIFSWDDQIRLNKAIKRAAQRGAKIILTNANHESIKCLYEGIGEHIHLERSNVMAAKPECRGKYKELIVKI